MTIFRDTVIDKWRVYGGYTNGSSISAVILRALLSTRTIAVTPYQRAFQSHRRSRFKSKFKWCQATLYSFIPISYLWSDRGRLIRYSRNEGNEGVHGEETETIRLHILISLSKFIRYTLYFDSKFSTRTRFSTNLIESFELRARIKARSLIRRRRFRN